MGRKASLGHIDDFSRYVGQNGLTKFSFDQNA